MESNSFPFSRTKHALIVIVLERLENLEPKSRSVQVSLPSGRTDQVALLGSSGSHHNSAGSFQQAATAAS